MAEIDGGGLSFKATLDNAQLNSAVQETLRRVQGLSDAVVGTGNAMDSATQEMVECIEIQKKVVQDLEAKVSDLNARIDSIGPGDAQNRLVEQANAARQELEAERQGLVALESQLNTLQQANARAAMSMEQIRAALGQIGAACEEQERALVSLEAEYAGLNTKMGEAFMSGNDDEYRGLRDKVNALKGEITVRKQLLTEMRQQSDALEEQASKMEKATQEAQQAAQAHVSFRTRLREVREELAAMELSGEQGSERYRELQNELQGLSEAMDAVTTQQNSLKKGERMWDGLLSGLSGVSGAFSAAQGAVALFAGENEDLQRIMLKVQSLMAITIGLKEVQLALDKDEAFRLVTLNGLKEWWNKLLAIGRGEQAAATATKVADTTATIADTAATTANTAAQRANTVATGTNAAATGGQATAAVAGTAANIGLAGAFRMVGAAIKSIPVFGWIIAGIAALVSIYSAFTAKAKEAAKAQKEFSEKMVESCYKPIGTIQELSMKWNALGDDLDAKRRFVEENQKAFNDLGVSVSGVTDAENLLIANKQAFINAQMEKAKATVAHQVALEKYKQALQKEEEAENVSLNFGEWVFSYGGAGEKMLQDKQIELRNEAKLLREEGDALFKSSMEANSKAYKTMTDAEILAIDDYQAGTVAALEHLISVKQGLMKQVQFNTPEGKADLERLNQEVKDLTKQRDAITGTSSGKKTGGGSSQSGKDPFLEQLAKYKTEYTRFMKWMNSGDETIVKTANQEFAGLLKEGATYIDYLKRQRDTIMQVDVANRTKAQNKQLRQLNDAIAEEAKQTVLEAFNNELSEQLTNAKTVLEMLNIIEQKRKELGDDNTELGNSKRDTLNSAEKDAQKQLQQETQALLDEYASYMEKRRRIDEQYNTDLALLQKKREQAQTDEERDEIDAAMKNRTAQHEKDTKGTGNADYDAMLEEYGTFEQRKQAIIDKYEEKRRTAQEMGNAEMLEALNNAQSKALSALASDELMGSEVWTNLFGNLDELTATQITTLVNEIDAKFETLSGVFNPIDLNAIRQKLEEAKAVLINDNPFKQIGESLKEVFSQGADDSKDSANKIKREWKKLGDSTEASFDFVNNAIGSCDFLKDAIGDVGATAIASMQSCAVTAIAVATAIKTAEKSSVILAIIQAALVVVQAVANFVKSIFGNQDKKIEKQINKWKEAVDNLKNAYTQLAWEIDKALGGQVYKTQKAAIRNMEQQQAYLKQMWEAEESKKKTDNEKVNEYKEQYAQLGREIEDMYDDIANDILQTDAKDFAGTLGDSLVEAFKKGEDASKALETTVNEVLQMLQNAVVNQLKKKFLEQQLQGALDNLEGAMGYWKGDDFIFDGLTDAEIADFKRKVQSAANNFNQGLDIYKDLFKDIADDDSDTSLAGAVKGVSEETASVISGQMNAIRINQLESTNILRQSLLTLNTIAANTSYNRYLTKIDRIISLLESKSGDSGLRSMGLS